MYYFAGCFHCTYTYLDGVDVALKAELSEVCTSLNADPIAQKVDKLTIGSFRDAMKGFVAAFVVENPNAEFWWDYVTVVSILLCFTRAQRDGSCHGMSTYMLSSVCCQSSSCTTMLITPDGGTVYLAEISVLPPEVLHEFQEGNFVVKRTDRCYGPGVVPCQE